MIETYSCIMAMSKPIEEEEHEGGNGPAPPPPEKLIGQGWSSPFAIAIVAILSYALVYEPVRQQVAHRQSVVDVDGVGGVGGVGGLANLSGPPKEGQEAYFHCPPAHQDKYCYMDGWLALRTLVRPGALAFEARRGVGAGGVAADLRAVPAAAAVLAPQVADATALTEHAGCAPWASAGTARRAGRLVRRDDAHPAVFAHVLSVVVAGVAARIDEERGTLHHGHGWGTSLVGGAAGAWLGARKGDSK